MASEDGTTMLALMQIEQKKEKRKGKKTKLVQIELVSECKI